MCRHACSTPYCRAHQWAARWSPSSGRSISTAASPCWRSSSSASRQAAATAGSAPSNHCSSLYCKGTCCKVRGRQDASIHQPLHPKATPVGRKAGKHLAADARSLARQWLVATLRAAAAAAATAGKHDGWWRLPRLLPCIGHQPVHERAVLQAVGAENPGLLVRNAAWAWSLAGRRKRHIFCTGRLTLASKAMQAQQPASWRGAHLDCRRQRTHHRHRLVDWGTALQEGAGAVPGRQNQAPQHSASASEHLQMDVRRRWLPIPSCCTRAQPHHCCANAAVRRLQPHHAAQAGRDADAAAAVASCGGEAV